MDLEKWVPLLQERRDMLGRKRSWNKDIKVRDFIAFVKSNE